MEKHLNIQATKYSAPKAQLYRSGDNSVICDKEDKIAVLYKFCKDIGCQFNKGSFFFSKNSIIINNQFDNDLKIELINHLKKSHVAMNTLNNNYSSLHNETKELVRKLNPNKTEQEIHKLAHNLLEIISLRNHGNFFENHNRYGKSTNTFIEALKLSIPNELCQQIKSREQIKQELMQSNIEKIPVASFKKITEEYQKNRIGLESVKAIYNHHQKYLNNKSEIFKNNYKWNVINNHNKNWTYGVKDQYSAEDYANNEMEKENKAFEVLKTLKNNDYKVINICSNIEQKTKFIIDNYNNNAILIHMSGEGNPNLDNILKYWSNNITDINYDEDSILSNVNENIKYNVSCTIINKKMDYISLYDQRNPRMGSDVENSANWGVIFNPSVVENGRMLHAGNYVGATNNRPVMNLNQFNHKLKKHQINEEDALSRYKKFIINDSSGYSNNVYKLNDKVANYANSRTLKDIADNLHKEKPNDEYILNEVLIKAPNNLNQIYGLIINCTKHNRDAILNKKKEFINKFNSNGQNILNEAKKHNLPVFVLIKKDNQDKNEFIKLSD